MTENEYVRIPDESLDNAISVYKTTIKAVEQSKDSDYCPILDKLTVALLEELKSYRAIGTIEDFKALKEKNTPKKVAYQVEHEKCPTCGSFHVFGKHCTECGQAVDYD